MRSIEVAIVCYPSDGATSGCCYSYTTVLAFSMLGYTPFWAISHSGLCDIHACKSVEIVAPHTSWHAIPIVHLIGSRIAL